MRPSAGDANKNGGDTQMKKEILISLAIAAGLALASTQASAYEAGDWRTTIGMTNIDPKQQNRTDLSIQVDDATQLSFTGAYFFTDSLAVELLASLPFEHDMSASGVEGVSTKHLPPTLNLQWHFNNTSKITPYVGAGLNYTIFFSTRTYGVYSGADVDIDNSLGYSLQAGLDYQIDENLFFNIDLRYIDIESDVKVDGTSIGDVEIDPTLVGISLGYRF
jgi:outer membrane protein